MVMHRTTRAVYGIALLTVAVHLAVNARYGFFRDELYFIACARHLALGYVDLPPLIPFITWLCAPFGFAVWTLRVLPAVAAGAAILVGCAIARELGGGRFAQTLTGVATVLAPIYLILGNILSTTSFEPLFWSLLIYFAIRLVKSEDDRIFFPIAAIVAVGTYAKYSMLICAAAIVFGLLVTGHGRILRSRRFALAIAIVAVVLAPNIAWQWQHGFPMREVIHDDQVRRYALQNGVAFESPNVAVNALYFTLMQLVYCNPLLSVLWIWGLIALLTRRELAPYRFVGASYVLLVALMIATIGRGYYLAGFYVALFAAGAVAVERAIAGRHRIEQGVVAAGACLAFIMVPIALPIFPVEMLIRYESALGISRPAPPDGSRHLISPLFADEFGWEAMTQLTARVYRDLPPAQRSQTAVYADGYGYAGALAYYGPRYGLPQPISANNTFYLWGTRGYDGRSMIAVGATDYPILLRSFRRVMQVAVYRDAYRWMIEGPLPIYLCTQPRAPLAALWPAFKRYGL